MLSGGRTNIIALAKLGNGLSDLHEILKEDANSDKRIFLILKMKITESVIFKVVLSAHF